MGTRTDEHHPRGIIFDINSIDVENMDGKTISGELEGLRGSERVTKTVEEIGKNAKVTAPAEWKAWRPDWHFPSGRCIS